MAFSLQRSAASTPLEDQTASPFARLAQASMLISRAMAHCKGATRRYVHRGASDPSSNSDEKNKNQLAFGVKEVMEIIRDLHILSRAIETGIASAGGVGSDAYFALSPSRCLVWSTIIMVMDLYSCPEHVSSFWMPFLPLQERTCPIFSLYNKDFSGYRFEDRLKRPCDLLSAYLA